MKREAITAVAGGIGCAVGLWAFIVLLILFVPGLDG